MRKRYVQEETDGLGHTELTQVLRQRDKVIVVDPDHVVRLEHRDQALGKYPVDATISILLTLVIAKAPHQVVKQGPQRRVRMAVVVRLEVAPAQPDGDVGDVVANQDLRLPGLLIGQLAAPTEPPAARMAQS